MGARDQRQTIVMIKRLADILPKGITRPARADAPATSIVGVAPQQIAHGPFVRHLLDAVELADIIERVDAGTEAAVQTKDLVIDERRQGQVVKEIREEFPHVCVAVLAQALIVEAVYLRDLTALVVAAEDGDAAWVANLEGDEQSDGLDAEITPVDVVAHEEIVGVRVRPADLEQLHQVVELPVDVAAHRHRAFDRLHVALFLQNFARFFAQPSHVFFAELLALHQIFDPAIEGGDGWRLVRRGAQRVLHFACVFHVRVGHDGLPQRGSLCHGVDRDWGGMRSAGRVEARAVVTEGEVLKALLWRRRRSPRCGPRSSDGGGGGGEMGWNRFRSVKLCAWMSFPRSWIRSISRSML